MLLLRVESLDLSLLGKSVEQVSKMYEGNKREAYIRMASQYLDDLVDVSYSRDYNTHVPIVWPSTNNERLSNMAASTLYLD